jgi:hypothetical protein
MKSLKQFTCAVVRGIVLWNWVRGTLNLVASSEFNAVCIGLSATPIPAN